eukprot:scaffold12357_cov91-Skeletonema_dohrnii-CCMP3373.AAC.7
MLEKCPVWDVVEEKKRTSEPRERMREFAEMLPWDGCVSFLVLFIELRELDSVSCIISVATNLYEKKTTGKEEVEKEKLDLEYLINQQCINPPERELSDPLN